MKKKIFGAAVVVAIAAMATLNLNLTTNANEISALTLSNVEALADGESDGKYAYVECDGHNIQCIGNGSYKCCV